MLGVMEKETAIFKFNSGRGALLCSKCSVIIKVGKDFTEEEKENAWGGKRNKLPPQYCDKCKDSDNKQVVATI